MQLLKMSSPTRNGNQIAREGSDSIREDAAKLCFVLPVTETVELKWQELGPLRSVAKEVRHCVVAEILIESFSIESETECPGVWSFLSHVLVFLLQTEC
jgi:hypothetical protein